MPRPKDERRWLVAQRRANEFEARKRTVSVPGPGIAARPKSILAARRELDLLPPTLRTAADRARREQQQLDTPSPGRRMPKKLSPAKTPTPTPGAKKRRKKKG